MMTFHKPIRLIALLIASACALTSIGGIALSLWAGLYFLTAFEVVVLLASAFGVLAGLGRLPGIETATMLVNGGVVFVGAVLGVPQVVTSLIQGGSALSPTAGSVNLVPWFLFRIVCAMGLLGLSGATLTLRTPRQSTTYLIRGAIVGLPVIAMTGAMLIPGVRQGLMQLAPPLLVFLGAIGFLVIASLVAVSGQNFIRAFEVGIEAGEREALSGAREGDSRKTDTPNP